ncbi:hypothetical protein [Bradyrhizobium sp. CCGUVB23]|uniref:hypothetical protein n=1 Tax=Bradyrhizobium sp. CCGUVB23 TaxID=2949630 RepID=UPI0020B23E38|nr:hypothetical protein [Bradyrhizobium sp. CCGUVB23]MCP3459778.1 hypothetical protein [Bradyrhizobium sp. CCGUVB23]
MVRKMAENGTYYHEPPYTEEEEDEFYRRVGGASSLTIAHRPASTPQPHLQKSPPPRDQ